MISIHKKGIGLDLEIDLSEVDAFADKLHEIGALPPKAANRAASKGGSKLLKAVKAAAPVGKTGNLKRYLKRAKERSKTTGKAAYRIRMAGGDAANSILQKKIRRPGLYGGKKNYAYYPMSVVYGFRHVGKGHWTGGKQEGYFNFGARSSAYRTDPNPFLAKAGDASSAAVKSAIQAELKKQLDTLWEEKSK